jgi:hypothetical protein
LFGQAHVLTAELGRFFLEGITLGFRTALLWSQGLENAGLALPPPRRQQGRVQPFASKQNPDTAEVFGLVHLGQDALFVFSGESAALGLGHDFGVRAGLRMGAGFAVSGTPVALATLGLPASHRRQSRWGRHGNRMVIH